MNAWTDTQVEALKTLWAEGRSASEIAQVLRYFSRNAVIGKAHRLELPKRAEQTCKQAAHKPKAARTTRVSTRRTTCAVQFGELEPAKKHEPVKTTFVPELGDFPRVIGATASLLARSEHQCAWPVGETSDPEFHYCTNTKHAGSSYCAGHHAIAWTPYKRRRSNEIEAEDAA